MTIMSMCFTRNATIAAWVVAFGLVALLASPVTLTTSVLILVVGGVVAPAIMLALWPVGPPPTIAEVLHHVEAPSQSGR